MSREFGTRDLSLGQWQRLAIARGLFREHDTILLDEPTASIDPLEEQAVYERFMQIAAGRTAIIVTHRLASARLADRILVLDAGRIVEDGTHEQLLARRGPVPPHVHVPGRLVQAKLTVVSKWKSMSNFDDDHVGRDVKHT